MAGEGWSGHVSEGTLAILVFDAKILAISGAVLHWLHYGPTVNIEMKKGEFIKKTVEKTF